MLSLGDVTFGLGADTNGMQKALDTLDKFQQRIEVVAQQQTTSSAEIVIAWQKQALAIRSAYQEASLLQEKYRQMGADPLTAVGGVTRAVQAYTNALSKGVLTSAEMAAASVAFKTALGDVESEVAKTVFPADAASRFAATLREVGGASTLALGQLNGVTSRLGALASIFTRTNVEIAAWVVGITGAVIALNKLAKGAIESEESMERIRAQLTLTQGDASRVGKTFNEVSQFAIKLGIDVFQAADNFAKLAIQTQAVGLSAEQTRQIFEGIETASKALELTQQQTTDIFGTFEQMLNRQIVDVRELRNRLGSELPASTQLAAKAMGVMSAQLTEMANKGQLASNVVLPKLAKVLQDTFGSVVLAQAQELEEAHINLSNAFELFYVKLNAATGISDSYKSSLNGLANVVNLVAGNIPNLIAGFTALAVAITVNAALSTDWRAIWLIAVPIINEAVLGIRSMATAIIAMDAVALASGVGGLLVVLGKLAVAAAAAAGAFAFMKNKMRESNDEISNATREVNEYVSTINRMKGDQAAQEFTRITDAILQTKEQIAQVKFQMLQAQETIAKGFAGDDTDLAVATEKQKMLQKQLDDLNGKLDEATKAFNRLQNASKEAAGSMHDDAWQLDKDWIAGNKALDDMLGKMNALNALKSRGSSIAQIEEYKAAAQAVGQLSEYSDSALTHLSEKMSQAGVHVNEYTAKLIEGNSQVSAHDVLVARVATQWGQINGHIALVNKQLDEQMQHIKEAPEALRNYNTSLQELADHTAALKEGSLALQQFQQELSNDREIKQWRSELEKAGVDQQTINMEIDAGTRALHQLNAAQTYYTQTLKPLEEGIKSMTNNGVNSMTDALISLEDRTKSVSQSFHDMAISILNDIEKMVIEQEITKPLETYLMGLAPTIAGALGLGNAAGDNSIFQNLSDLQNAATQGGNYASNLNLILPEAFSGGRAAGGPVSEGNSYMVGENGPEIVTMGGNGMVMPLNGGSNQPIVNIQIVNNTGANISAKRSGNGADMQIILDQAVAGVISQPGSKSQRAINSMLNSQGVISR